MSGTVLLSIKSGMRCRVSPYVADVTGEMTDPERVGRSPEKTQIERADQWRWRTGPGPMAKPAVRASQDTSEKLAPYLLCFEGGRIPRRPETGAGSPDPVVG